MPKQCDNRSVGIIIEQDERYLTFKRATDPPGEAPPAGHVDVHGNIEQAARIEVSEEVGLTKLLNRNLYVY
ncbi:NUDIX hydrolase, partial [Sphaerisporangium sp. NPDC049002]|uniref:NUDIX hydrolase n=1 Tax=Sphaerisporangium sp. NPDC049002 TaxID=3155392 RepID=UPI0033F9937E